MTTSVFQTANALRKDAKFDDAIELYAANWRNEDLPRYEWDVWSYAFCLRKAKRYGELLDFCRVAFPSYGHFEPFKVLYAWAIYYTTVAQPDRVEVGVFMKAAKGIMRLCAQADVYSPFTLTVFKVLDSLASKNKFPAREILEWTGLLNPELLEAQPFVFKNKEGKQQAVASRLEQYFMWRAKAFLLSAQYEDCDALVELAFASNSQWHYGNEHWLKRIQASALVGLERLQEASMLLLGVWAHKKDWFVAFDMAKLSLRMNNPAQGFSCLLKAVLSFGDMEKKVKVYRALADFLMEHDRVADALLHFELIALIRSDFGWSQDAVVDGILLAHDINVGFAGSSLALYERLQTAWATWASAAAEIHRGSVMSILGSGKSGFLKDAADGKSYFFHFKHICDKQKNVVVGQSVSFELEAAFDAKKQLHVLNAVRVCSTKL